jgi:hypothetical protein
MPDRTLSWKGIYNCRDAALLPAAPRTLPETQRGGGAGDRPGAAGRRRLPLSDERLRPLYLSQGQEDEAPAIAEFLRGRGTTATAVIVDTLATLDVEATLPEAGLKEREIAVLRQRLVQQFGG